MTGPSSAAELSARLLAAGDTRDFTTVNDLARSTGWLHAPMVTYAGQGVALFAVLLIVGYLLARAKQRPLMLARALLAGAGALLAVAVNQPIVHAVNEPRPYTQLPHALLLVHRSMDASFPSDHATMAGAVAAGLLCVHRKLGPSPRSRRCSWPSLACTSGRTSPSTCSPASRSVPSSHCSCNGQGQLLPGY